MLPQVLPMLAVAAEPFDSLEYCFEIKYDGVRALAAVDETGWRLWGRERADYTARYPELDVLRRLRAGTLVDGELVAFEADGRPHLWRLLRRHGLTDPWRIRQARRRIHRNGVRLLRRPALKTKPIDAFYNKPHETTS
jgi:ATP-dependent DNA ligase